MPSIKCSQCNLVNYSTQTHCKRCQNPLNDYAPVADHRQFQTNFEQTYQTQSYPTNFEQSYSTQPVYQNQNPFQSPPAQYQPYQSPPPPAYYSNQYQPQQHFMSCLKCGTGGSIAIYNFKKEYVPPLAYLALLIGILPGALIILLIKVRHRVDAPFCHECWSKFKNVGTAETLSSLFFFFGFIAALFFGIALESFVAFLVIFAVTIGVFWKGIAYSRKHNLKFKRVNSRQVIVTHPHNGDVSLVG